MDSGRIAELLSDAADVHAKALRRVQDEYNEQVRLLNQRIKTLSEQLGEAGVKPANDLPFGPDEVVPAERAQALTNGYGDDCPDDKEDAVSDDNNDVEGQGEGGRLRTTTSHAFQLKAEWTKDKEDTFDFNLDPARNRTQLVERNTNMMKSFGFRFRLPRTRAGFVVSPNSTYRMFWDLCGMVLIGYDCVMIPFGLSFEPEQTSFLASMDMLLLLFWTLDMVQAFNLGYYYHGSYVDSHRRIFCNYMKTWFGVDLVVVGPEWLSIFAGQEDSLGGLGRILKGTRAIRVLRLLRLLKLQRIVNMLYDMLESEYAFIIVNLVKLLIGITLLNHVIACLWFWIGRACLESEIRNWISVAEMENDTLSFKYSTSLHWSLTQFTPASMDVSARNVFERVFSILVLLFAMVAFSSIVASITSAMTNLRNLASDSNKQFWLLRRYLRQRKISSDLCGRIVKFLEYQQEKQSTVVQVSSIKIMSGLSEELSREMAHSMHAIFLVSHPFFMHLEVTMQNMMHRLCYLALKHQSYAENEIIFNCGDESHCMFFIKGGEQSYKFSNGERLDPPPMPKEWASEAILWTSWRHRGILRAEKASEFIQLPPSKFMDVMGVHPKPWALCQSYAPKFVMFLGSAQVQISDFLRHEDFYQEAVDALRASTRSSGAAALRQNGTNGSSST
eukprot:TRINITY_DN12231_c0_g2_i1.p1 TRINITY_DN12231_c0_g2~~TRINITY_DN12231_c0_g2_i1.p1  ORF type:complete len:672 (+),score=137.24 TRINITY_DN12231_c0_g2_i1:319-2334(+)